MMKRKSTKRAFTLVELLTVVAIIALLIGMLVPAVNRAQLRAKEVAVRAQLYSIEQGLEMFKTDMGYYPSSLPQSPDGVEPTDGDNDGNLRDDLLAGDTVTGAHRLSFAMIGRDQAGTPASRGMTTDGLANAAANRGPDSITGWYYSAEGTDPYQDGSFRADWKGPAAVEWGDPDAQTERRGPYIAPNRVTLAQDEQFNLNGDETVRDYIWLICDRFDKYGPEQILEGTNQTFRDRSIILYYAANERGSIIADAVDGSDNIYYPEDNARIVAGNFADVDGSGTVDGNDFFAFIEDESAEINNFRRPFRPDSFLLISRGIDTLYGTDDDIVNWNKP